MIYEKLNCISIDVESVRTYFINHVLKFEPVFPSPNFGGWTIQSYTGRYTDGWQNGQNCFEKDPTTGNTVFNMKKAKEIGLRRTQDHVNFTEVGTAYIKTLIEEISSLGFTPCRARFSILKANSSSSLHQDGLSNAYNVRMHIPILTNENCYFSSEGEQEHAPADGSAYLVKVNRLHQVFNNSNRDRLHIIIDVWDTHGHSKFHKFSSN